jgi:universal stress protein A
MDYSHILLAVDLTDESTSTVVSNRAVALAQQNNARLSLIHVIEPISVAYGGDAPIDLSEIQEKLYVHARGRMKSFSEQFGVQTSHQFLVSGNMKTEVHRIVEQEGVDLVVVGSHGRHGLGLLLGSTVNSILHGSTCDVLAVRVPKTD